MSTRQFSIIVALVMLFGSALLVQNYYYHREDVALVSITNADLSSVQDGVNDIKQDTGDIGSINSNVDAIQGKLNAR